MQVSLTILRRLVSYLGRTIVQYRGSTVKQVDRHHQVVFRKYTIPISPRFTDANLASVSLVSGQT